MKTWRLLTLMTMMMVASVCLAGGDITKKILYILGDDGTLYFVLPKKMPKQKESKALKYLLYDVTCLNAEDSVSFTSTHLSSSVYQYKEATIKTSGMEPLKAPIEVIFIDPKGKKYENRLRIRLSREDFKKLYKSPTPYVIDYGNGMTFGLKAKDWAKESHFMNEVFIMIDMSK